MDAGSILVGAAGVADARFAPDERYSDTECGRRDERSAGRGRACGRADGGAVAGNRPVLVAALAVAALLVAAAVFRAQGVGVAPGSVGTVVGVVTFGAVGLAARGDSGGDIEELRAAIERFRAGEEVDFDTDREDEVGDLYDAVESIAADLRESQRERELWERVLKAAPVGVTVADTTMEDNPLMTVNDRFEELTGYDEADIIGRNCRFLQGEATDEEPVAEMRQAIDAGEPVTVELRNYRADGTEFWNRVRLAPVEGRDGEVTHYAGFQEDVTDRVEREAKREHQLELLFENTDDVIYVKDREGRYELMNEAGADYLGLDPAEVVGRRDADLFDEDIAADIRGDDERVLESGETVTREVVRRVDGEDRVFLDSKFPYHGDDGDIAGMMGISRDITERKARERELRATKERLQKFIETSPVGIVATDSEGTVTLWNDAMAEIFGWSADEVIGEPYPAVPEDVDDDSESIRQRALDGESFSQVELERVTRDGDRIDVSLSTGPIRDESGEVTEIVGYIEDITERKERELELAARSAAMEGAIDGMAILDETGEYLYVNRAHAEMYGYDDPAAFTGEAWEMCYSDAERERMGEEVLPVLRPGENWRGEAVGRRADGTTFPQELSLSGLADGRMVCVVRDITERKERERELRRTKDLLQQAGRIAGIGGWELDVSGDDPEMTWTDELYRLHDVSPDTDVDLETALSFYHPDDRAQIRENFQRAMDLGESYDMEVRLQTDGGSRRWVRAIGEPVREGQRSAGDREGSAGDVVRVRGSIQDITAQKERELALESLHETTRGLLGVGSDAEAAGLVVETAESVLDVAGTAVYLLDASSNRLDAVACSDGFRELCDGAPPVGAGGGDSLLWNAYVTGTPTVFDDTETVAQSQVFGPDVRGGLLVPLGDHGVFVVATAETTIDDATRRLAETLVATAEAAFDRIDSEASLRERDEELEARNRRLRRQIQITDLIRRIDQSLIQAGSRAEIETTVCDRLVESDDVVFAWIGALDSAGDRLQPGAWAGDGEEYLDAVSLAVDGEHPEPAVATATSEEPTVVGNVVDDLKRDPWRKAALAHEFNSVVSVPLAFGEYFYGVLTVYADEPDAFGDLERTVFAELGENIAHSINAVETQRALHADQLVELRLRFDADDDVLGRLARQADCRVDYEGLAAYSEDEATLFVSVSSVPVEAVSDALDELVAVHDYRLVTENEDGVLFEVTVAGETIVARFVRHGASPKSVRVTAEGAEAVVDVPTATDIREFVEMLREADPSVELTSRRTVERAADDRTALPDSLFEALTDRQLEVLRTAYFAGFFEWPRTSTGEDVAEMLDVTQPTVNRHLRLAQQRLLAQLFEDAPAADAD